MFVKCLFFEKLLGQYYATVQYLGDDYIGCTSDSLIRLQEVVDDIFGALAVYGQILAHSHLLMEAK